MKAIPMNSQPENEDCGEFAVFRDLDALAAYLHHKYGDDALRKVFGQAFDPNNPPECAYSGGGPKETLEDTATELEKRGLDKPATILRDLAKDAISGIDLVPDYMERAGPQFVEAWRRSWLQRRHIHLGTWGQELRRHEAETARQSEINSRKAPSTQH